MPNRTENKELGLKRFSPQEPMKISDYFSLFYSMKAWLKIADKHGNNLTLVYHFLFVMLMASIFISGLNYVFPNVFSLGRSLISVIVVPVLNVYIFKNYLEKMQLNKKASVNFWGFATLLLVLYLVLRLLVEFV